MFKSILVLAIAVSMTLPAAAKTGPTNPSKFSGSNGYNFRISPLSLLVGGIAANFDMAINSEWTVGPTVSYLNWKIGKGSTLSEDISLSAYSIGARANWYKNGVHSDGMYLAPALVYSAATATAGTSKGEASGLFLSGVIGYGWFWDSFNMLLGGGFSTGLGNSKVQVKDSATGQTTETSLQNGGLALEWTTGWTF